MPRTTPTSATQLTTRKALKSLPEFQGGTFRLDTFTNQVVIEHAIAAPNEAKPRSWRRTPYDDAYTTMVVEILEANAYTKVKRAIVDAAVMLQAHYSQFSSALELIEQLPEWDGVARLDKFFFDVCGVEREPEGLSEDGLYDWHRYHGAIARALFISIVARITTPGCKVDSMVVLEGPQGELKSTLLRALAFDRDELFSDSMPHNLSSKDARQHLLGKLIIEFGEVNQMRASRIETVKGFLSAQDDRFRPPYGRYEVTRPRQCVFVGTTNDDGYLVDITGNRRFWPVRCGKIDLALLRGSRDQLYAEAFAARQAGERWWLDPELERIAAAEQVKRLAHDPWEARIAKQVEMELEMAARRAETLVEIVPTDMLQLVGVEHRDWDQGSLKRVCAILRKMGGKNSRLASDGGVRKRAIRFEVSPNYPR